MPLFCVGVSTAMQNNYVTAKYLRFLNISSFNDFFSFKDEKPHEDILTEFKTEGFLVDAEEILERVKRETSLLSDKKPSTLTNNEDIKDPTSKPYFEKTPSILLFDTEGSGSGLVGTETTESYFNKNNVTEDLVVVPVQASNVNQKGECYYKSTLHVFILMEYC